MYDDYIGGQPLTAPRTVSAAQAHKVRQTLTTSTSIADTASTSTNSSSKATNFPNTSQDVDGLNSQQQHAQQQGNQAPLQPETVADNLGDLKGKSKDNSCVSDTLNPLSQKLKNENVELVFQVLNYAKENSRLKTTYKNLFDSISVSRTQTKTIIASLQNKLHNTVYENAKLRAQLFNKGSDQKDNTCSTITNTKFAKKSIVGNLPKGKKHVPNTVRASARTKPITVSQPTVFTKKDVNSDSNGLSSTGIDNTKTRRQQPRSNTKNDKVPFTSKSSRNKNKGVEVEEHNRNLLLSKNKKYMSSACIMLRLLLRILNLKLFVLCVIQICLWCVDSGCSKHMTENLKLLINFVWKFLGTVRFGNDHVAAIMGFGDLQWGNILITRVYFVDGLGHNLFSVGQFCDSDLEVAFRRNACFIRNLEGVDLLSGNRTTNLYTINIHEIASASPICLMARLPKFKYHKEHLCPFCEQGKSKRASHPPKPIPNSRQRLHLLHMDLCSPMRIASINGKRALCYPKNDREDIGKLGAKAMAFEQRSLKPRLQSVTFGQINSGLDLTYAPSTITTRQPTEEFKNQVLKEYFDTVGISHQMSSVRTPQQKGGQNQTLVEAARTIKPDISFLYVFGALCYPKNDREDIGKLGAKSDTGFFIGYSADSCVYRVYNRRTKKIIETMNVSFDELSAMAFEQRSSKPGLNSMTSGHISSGLDLTYAPSTITTQQPSEGELDLLFESMYADYIGGQPSATVRTVPPAQEPQVPRAGGIFPGTLPLDRVEVLGMIEKRSKVRIRE
nr:retrovirus-related Pol polyprotein from transposon TNT 1-94 [Tanacetum cinerariifolium]